MLARISWQQFLEWKTYAELEPFGDERADIRSAQVATMIANVNRGKGVSAYKIEDFLLHFGDWEPQKKTWQQLKVIGRNIAAMFGVS